MPTQAAEATTQLSVLLPAALGVAGAGAANVLLRVWQYGYESWGALARSLRETLEKLGDAGAEYWCTAGASHDEDAVREAKILGLQARIDGLIGSLSERMHPSHRRALELGIARVRNAATGGTFQSARLKSPQSAIELETAISDLIVEIQKAELFITRQNLHNAIVAIFTISLACFFIYLTTRP